jgi:branched-chain amino acid aminotransferase
MPRKVDSLFVWSDGVVIPAAEAKVSFFAHALHYGTSVFEGIRCYDGAKGRAVFRLREHLERLRRSAGHYFMKYKWSDEELTDGVLDLVRRHPSRECYIRPVVLTGEGRMGVRPRECDINVLMTVWTWGTYLGPEALEKGIRAAIVHQRKFSPKALDPTVKASGHYLNSVLATKEAESGGFDEAILLNRHGRIAEGSGENIFLVKDGTLITNPPEESLLMGVTRDSVLQIAENLDIPVIIRPFTPDDLIKADEAFMTGTAAEVTPIREVNDHKIGNPDRPITRQLQSIYLDAVHARAGAEYLSWLTFVDQ